MRFFSNEAKENDNEQERDRAESEGLPTPVPQQRVGSPWSDAPGNAEAGPDALRRDDSEVRHNGDDLVRDDDAPRRDEDELDLPLDDHAGTHRVESDGVADEPGAEQRAGTTTTYGPDGTITTVDDAEAGDRRDADEGAPAVGTASVTGAETRDDEPAPAEREAGAVPMGAGHEHTDTATTTDTVDTDHERADEAERAGAGDLDGSDSRPAWSDTNAGAASPVDAADRERSDAADRDTAADGPADVDAATAGAEDVDAAAAGPETDEAGTERAAAGTSGADTASLTDAETGSRDSEAEGVTGAEAAGADTGDAGAAAVPVGAAAAATAAKPDPSASPVGDRLFTDGDSFNERLRDIALSFVDDPKDATRQAGALVDEAIEKVTSALKAQKDALAGEGDDTERLRVELRGYREILKRISSL